MTPDDARHALARELGAVEMCHIDQPNHRICVVAARDTLKGVAGLLLGAWRGNLPDAPDYLAAEDGPDAIDSYGWALLVGVGAVAAWRGDITMAEAEGRWAMRSSSAMVMGLRNPFALDSTSARAAWSLHAKRFFVDAGRQDSRVSLLSIVCCRCDRDVWEYDVDGIGWCKKHHAEIKRESDKRSKHEEAMRQGQGQGKIL